MLSLLTLVAGSTNSEHMLNAAVVLQSGLGAELVVVYASPIAEIPTVVGDAFGYVPMINPEDIDRYRKNARAAFDKLCGSNPRSHFKDTNASIAYSLRKFAMFADLGVLTRDYAGLEYGLLKEALVANRLPTVMMPSESPAKPPASIVFSWNGEAPSARALRAAVPFIKSARQFVVLEHKDNEVNRSRLERFIANQGITVSGWRQYGERGLTARGRARALLSTAKAEGADLLVMGAYGESDGAIFRFGRATDKVASAAKIPVLFSS